MIDQLPLVVADQRFASPPVWAVLQRQLIASLDAAISPMLDRYVRDDGTLYWPTTDDHQGVDALDDAYESFFSWPLCYLLGGSERFLAESHREFDAITAQFARYATGFGHPMVVKEYEQGYDWFHQSEGYTFFYYLSMADPDDERTRARATRFAGFYLNEDPQALNWDSQLQLVKAPCTGSMGPAQRNFTGAQFTPFRYFDHLKWAGLPFQDVPGISRPTDLLDDEHAQAMGEVMQQRQARGDVPANLAITSLMANAFLFTGDRKYRDWIADYTTAWWHRTVENGGVIPDNVGLSGKIGEYTEGKWYGGYYGWTWPTGWQSLGSALMCAAENALLVTGDRDHLRLVRSQLQELLARAVTFESTLHLPTRFGDPGPYELDSIVEGLRGEDIAHPMAADADAPLLWHEGWFDYAPADPEVPTHLWFGSSLSADRELIATIRNHRRPDWHTVLNPMVWRPTTRKNQAGHEQAWLAYLDGDYPDYPIDILSYNLAQLHYRLDYLRRDVQDPSTYADYYLQQRNPITVEGLVQLTLGAPMPIYNGGLLMARVRYFDLQRRRPGLPADVAALVSEVGPEQVTIDLVNLSPIEPRELIIQAGGFAEHHFVTARYTVAGPDETPAGPYFDPASPTSSAVAELAVDGRWLRVSLPAGSAINLHLGMRLFAHQPAHGFDWTA